jgi:type III restriction enzyme
MAFKLKDYQQRTLNDLREFLELARTKGPEAAFQAVVADDSSQRDYEPIANENGVPIAELVDVPYVCLRVPTGGGKTVMGAHIIKVAARSYLDREYPLVLWLVPTKQIKSQTLEAFKNTQHPYRRELDEAFQGRVAVFDVSDAHQIKPQDLKDRICLVIGTMATARVTDPEIRSFYAHKEAFEPHFLGLRADHPTLELEPNGGVAYSFANLLRLHRPLLVADEAHNATTKLSYAVYERLSPALIVELTATPDMDRSNVLVHVSASELKAEEMIKLPVVLKEHTDNWEEALRDALQRRQHLEVLAEGEDDYLRPILLIQAENENLLATVDIIRRHLIQNENISAETIAIATGDQRELDGVNLFDRNCAVRIVITKDALKEGWDCSFAYVLCSVTNQRSGTAIEQLLGRVLRMPYAKLRKNQELNQAYAHVLSPAFGLVAQELTDDLERMGFTPLEAATNIVPQTRLDLGAGRLLPERTVLHLPSRPDLTNIPAADRSKVSVNTEPAGTGIIVNIEGAIDDATQDALVRVLPEETREEARRRLHHHNLRAIARETPAQRQEEFRVPTLRLIQGELNLRVDADLILDLNGWSIGQFPADLASFRFDEQSKTFLVDLDGEQVSFEEVDIPQVSYLDGLAGEWDQEALVLFLDRRIRQPDVPQAQLFDWIGKAIMQLTERGFSLAQLVRGKFMIARKLLEQIEVARKQAALRNYQEILFADEATIETSFDYSYRFNPNAYPTVRHCESPYRWKRHFYSVPGDLPYKRRSGALAEEYQCAMQIDLLEKVEFWVRNLVHPTQFWLPTLTGRTYPDFVAKLRDGRIFVIEYKGGDRVTNEDSRQKEQIGRLWAKASDGKALYLMVTKTDDHGRDIRGQLLAAMDAG